MATTKIWPVSDNLKRLVDYASNPDKTVLEDGLWNVIHYSSNDKKTGSNEQTASITGIACSSNNAYADMMTVKKHFGKVGGNVAYHAYQSFKPNEVSPEQCHEIGVKLAKRLWGKSYQVLVTTHLDKEHCHNHFVINSVSYTTGKKFNDNKKTYAQMKEASDDLCRRYKLSVIEHPNEHTPRNIYFAEKNNEPTQYNLMREAIDKAISMSLNGEQFRKALLKLGYTMNTNPNRKYPTICSVNSKKPVRLYRLGEEYLPQNISARIKQNPYDVQAKFFKFIYPQGRAYGRPIRRQYQIKHYRLKGSFKSIKHKATGIEALFIIFGYLLGVYPKNKPTHKPLSPEVRQACRQIDKYTEQIDLICKEHFNTEDDVKAFISSAKSQVDTLCKQRRKYYDLVSKAETENEKNDIRQQYQSLTLTISRLRKDIKTANRIIESKPKVEQYIQAEHNSRELVNAIENNRIRKDIGRDR